MKTTKQKGVGKPVENKEVAEKLPQQKHSKTWSAMLKLKGGEILDMRAVLK